MYNLLYTENIFFALLEKKSDFVHVKLENYLT